jgi:hypothetical protein
MGGEISSAGGLGAGLSAVCRIADEVEFDNRIREGLCVAARKFETRAEPLCCEAAIMGKPYPGEAISGDDGVYFQSESGFVAGVADGLGHGPEARQASQRAIEILSRDRNLELDRIVANLNRELAGTRGCAMSIVRFSKNDRLVECASLGDVQSHLYHIRDAALFASTPFVLGDRDLPKRPIRIEKARARPGTVLVMFTDGLKSGTNLKGRLDILRQAPIAIAQQLLEHDSRPDDDALVLAARFVS